MRIDAYNAVSQVYQTNTKMQTKTNQTTSFKDQFEISQTAKSYQVAKQAVSNASDIREDKVADIKARMQAGTYSVTPQEFADKILENAETITF